eukprot:COSAG02_NODE_60398_length_271_cov_0.895349_1_plen_47_part_10
MPVVSSCELRLYHLAYAPVILYAMLRDLVYQYVLVSYCFPSLMHGLL